MEGSTFKFSLEFQKTHEVTLKETDTVEICNQNKNIKVLVVEDIALNQLLMKTLLDDFGFVRDIASNGKIAIEKLEKSAYDIILMDLQMPEMNGFEATEYIRNEMKLKIPIIALTADVTTVDLAKCTAVGMNDYIAKPVDERVLYSKIIKHVKKTNLVEINKIEKNIDTQIKQTNLTYLLSKTKSNPEILMEMILLYLEQTPPLILSMKQSLHKKDWNLLHASVHKMIPSFAIVGIHKDYENMARNIQEYAINQEHNHDINDMVSQIVDVCNQACNELKEEYIKLKNNQ
jgi:CheY-like chemotaxis protein